MRTSKISFLLLAIVAVTAVSASAATYEIGPGKTYTNIVDFAWEDLVAGDTVLIYHRATPYKEKFGIFVQGTQANPITISGVAGSGGELPIIDGSDAVHRMAQSYWSDERGVIKLGGTNIPANDPTPTWIIFENLDIKSARPPYTYMDEDGPTLKTYVDAASSFFIEKGKNITIRNCILRDCGNGFFTASSDAEATENILLQGNHIYDNGIDGSIYHHNNYTASLGIIHEYNHMGPLRAGCSGNNLKDRSAGQIVRYNFIEGGNRQLDLINAEDSIIISGDPSHDETHVYGNVIVEYDMDGNRQMLHYGKDTNGGTRDGTLYLYNNTFATWRTDRNTFLRISGGSTCVIELRNNIFYSSLYRQNYIELTSGDSRKGTVNLRNCWLKTDWVPGGNITLNNYGGNVEEMDPLFVDGPNSDYHLSSSSNNIDAGIALDPAVLPDNNVVSQYVYLASYEARPNDGTFDIGAFEFVGGPPATLEITTTSLPNGQDTVAYSETLAATGGVTPYTWTLFSGSLPAGLALSSGGVVSGTPTTEETANFTVQVEDSDSPTSTDTQALSITIDAAPVAPTITTTTLPDGIKGDPYSATVVATGGTTPYTWTVVAGDLGNGLSLNSSTGEISGTPRGSTGTRNFTIRCTDDASAWDEQALSITIN